MFGNYVLLAVVLGLASCEISKQQPVSDQQSQNSHSLGSVYEGGYEAGGDFGGSFDSDGGKHNSNGAELTSLAHSSAIQAKNAVQKQLTAGSQAAFGIKSSLASAALGAAQTAQAALVGKQAIVQNLKKQAAEAQSQLHEEIAQSQQVEAVAAAAHQAAQQAQSQLNSLSAALASAQGGAQGAQQAASEAANAAASQQSMVSEAKQRVVHIIAQLQVALSDLQETEAAAHKAAEAAQIAQSNAQAAGLAVATTGAAAESSKYHH